MSKKKGKPAARSTRKTTAVRRSAPAARAASGTSSSRTVQATIFLYRTGSGNKIRTSPQRMYANPGDHVEWTVVNMVDGSDVPVTLTWPDGGPWGRQLLLRNWDRQSLEGAKAGRYKYVVTALDAHEDPELEIPEM